MNLSFHLLHQGRTTGNFRPKKWKPGPAEGGSTLVETVFEGSKACFYKSNQGPGTVYVMKEGRHNLSWKWRGGPSIVEGASYDPDDIHGFRARSNGEISTPVNGRLFMVDGPSTQRIVSSKSRLPVHRWCTQFVLEDRGPWRRSLLLERWWCASWPVEGWPVRSTTLCVVTIFESKCILWNSPAVLR